MNTPNHVTFGLYCEIDRFRCLKCGHDDYSHRYRCGRHLVGDGYCREAIPMITPDRNVFCGDCEDDDLETSDQGHMSPEPPAIQSAPDGSNITPGGTGSQPASTSILQSPGSANSTISSGGWSEPGGVQLSTLNSQSPAHASPDQDHEIAPLASQTPPAATSSSENNNTITGPPPTPAPIRASEPTPSRTPAPPSSENSNAITAPAPTVTSASPPTPAAEPSPEPSSEPALGSTPAAEIRYIGIWETLRSWFCGLCGECAA